MKKNNVQENIKNTYTKDILIKSIAKECRMSAGTVHAVYHKLEEIIARLLSSANENTDIVIRLFEGITIDSSYVPETEKLNNLTGEIIMASSKIKPKVNITRNYREKLTDYNKFAHGN